MENTNILIIGLAVATVTNVGLLIAYLFSRKRIKEIQGKYEEFDRFRKNFARQIKYNEKVSNLTYDEREGGLKTWGDFAKVVHNGGADGTGALCHILPLMALDYERKLERIADRKGRLQKQDPEEEESPEDIAKRLITLFSKGNSAKGNSIACVDLIINDLKESYKIVKDTNPHAVGIIAGSLYCWNQVREELEEIES